MIPLNIKCPPGAEKDMVEKLTLAEDQPEYIPVPALFDRENHTYMTWWKPTPEELQALQDGGAVLYCVHGRFPPMSMDVVRKEGVPELESVN